MFSVGGMIEARRARVLIIARSKATTTAMLFRTSYHEHTGASGFGHSIDGKHGNIIMGLILITRKVAVHAANRQSSLGNAREPCWKP